MSSSSLSSSPHREVLGVFVNLCQGLPRSCCTTSSTVCLSGLFWETSSFLTSKIQPALRSMWPNHLGMFVRGTKSRMQGMTIRWYYRVGSGMYWNWRKFHNPGSTWSFPAKIKGLWGALWGRKALVGRHLEVTPFYWIRTKENSSIVTGPPTGYSRLTEHFVSKVE